MTKATDLHSLSFDQLKDRIKKAGGQRALSRQTGIPRTNLQRILAAAELAQFAHRPAPKAQKIKVKQGVRRFILTSAQDQTKIHEGFLDCLEAYRDWLQLDAPCELMISGFTYSKRLFEENRPELVSWPQRIRPYLDFQRVRLGEMIDWCGEMNTSPSASQPLTGFETYTRHRWGIFPHAKVQLRSVPTMKDEPAKVIMTTGAITLPNYVRRRAGLKASFNHTIGAVLVEIAADGTFFARHLIADKDGSFYDLDRHITTAGVEEGCGVEAINHGDLHTAQIDPVISRATFGYYPTDDRHPNGERVWRHCDKTPTMLDTLRPKHQLFHDVADFMARNHHNLRDPHHQFRLWHHQRESVRMEMAETAQFIQNTRRPWCKTVVVESNHDLALLRWLREGDYRNDPINAVFFLECQTAIYKAMERNEPRFSIFEWVMQNHAELEGVRFLRQDESYRVLDIEKGMHGHLGANGSRGAPAQYARMGPKATTGHTHSCGIIDGIYTAGTKSLLDLGYNLGLSSWSHSDVITLLNGKRQIVTWSNGRWRL